MIRALPLLLAVATMALFAVGITNTHLQLDDWGYTAGCPFVASGLSPDNVAQALLNLGYGGIWMPLTYTTYMADVSLFGGSWAAHHAVNVVLHAINALLVYAFLLTLLRRLWPQARHLPLACFLAALIWAVHPMRAEAVVWIASRKEELWTMFALLASLAWLRYLKTNDLNHYCFTFLAFVLACLAKPTALCLPFVLFLLEGLVRTKPRTFRLKSLLSNYLLLLLVSVAVGCVAIRSQVHPTNAPAVEIFDFSLPWRIVNAAVALGMYLWHTLVPCGIHIDYRAVPNGMPLDAALGLTVLALACLALAVALVRTRGPERRVLIFAVAAFAVTLFPVLGIVGFTGDKAYADRYLYLPSVALMIPFAAGIAWSLSHGGMKKAAPCVLLVSAVLAVLAVPIIRSLRDDSAAYGRVLSFDPDHWRGLRIIGTIRCTQPGRMDDGVALLCKSLARRPSQTTANALAYVLALRGKPGDFAQVKKLGAAFIAQPTLDREGMMLEALATVAMREGRHAEAARLFRIALRAPARSHSKTHALQSLKQINGLR